MADDLKRLSADLTDAGAKARARASLAVRKTAHDLEAAAKPLTRYRFGYLRNSIGSDIHDMHAVVGPTVEYAPHQEFGTRYMEGTHYMSRGTDIVTPGFIAAIAQAGIDPIVGGAS